MFDCWSLRSIIQHWLENLNQKFGLLITQTKIHWRQEILSSIRQMLLKVNTYFAFSIPAAIEHVYELYSMTEEVVGITRSPFCTCHKCAICVPISTQNHSLSLLSLSIFVCLSVWYCLLSVSVFLCLNLWTACCVSCLLCTNPVSALSILLFLTLCLSLTLTLSVPHCLMECKNSTHISVQFAWL